MVVGIKMLLRGFPPENLKSGLLLTHGVSKSETTMNYHIEASIRSTRIRVSKDSITSLSPKFFIHEQNNAHRTSTEDERNGNSACLNGAKKNRARADDNESLEWGKQ